MCETVLSDSKLENCDDDNLYANVWSLEPSLILKIVVTALEEHVRTWDELKILYGTNFL